ncbi:hypothetical protein ACH5RR_022963 [Cinchona calisaya]|uniref:Subtilisin-like protease fibronectin type-III domain-containing protein n=1 Tax=Cinchona calisaya TaxID=153742 RepID=A0ABD2Z9A6_9GENT
MTTANILDMDNSLIHNERRLPTDIFTVGASHVNPLRAVNPGLVYDIKPDEYIPYLCGLGYLDDKIRIIVNRRVYCANINSIPEAQLNYPSFAIQLGTTTQTYSRTATNVGKPISTYQVKLDSVPMVNVNVRPQMLNFTKEFAAGNYSRRFTMKRV